MSRRDYQNDVIETLAASEAALLEQVAELAERAVNAETDRDALRLVAAHALHHAHHLHLAVVDATQRHQRALDDARNLRAQMLRMEEEGSHCAA